MTLRPPPAPVRALQAVVRSCNRKLRVVQASRRAPATWPSALPSAFLRHLWGPHLWPPEPSNRVGHASKPQFVRVLTARTGGLGR